MTAAALTEAPQVAAAPPRSDRDLKLVRTRPLYANERGLVEKMASLGELGAWYEPGGRQTLQVAYRYQEHRQGVYYTVALVLLHDASGSVLVGASKWNPEDKYNRIRGQIAALRRALESSVAFDGPCEVA